MCMRRGYMKKYFWLFGSLFFVLFSDSRALGQDDEPVRKWSVAVFSGFDYSPTASMNGSIEDYQTAIRNGTTASQYPFGGYKAYSIGFEAQLAYRYPKSPLSLYFNGYGSSFNAGYGFRFSPSGRYTLTVASGTAGIEYTFGQLYQHWNFFGRFGINSNIIASSFRMNGQNRFNDTTLNGIGQRFGFEIEVGERYNISRLPFGIEASINYSNVNLIGKSYTAPVFSQGLFGRGNAGDINDGKNPSDANDNARVIDYFSFRLGARYYF
jgi:hypothetical protein